MQKNSHTLSHEQFERLFPFYIVLNPSMQIEACGKSLLKLFPFTEKCDFEDYFSLIRPQIELNSFDDLVSCQGILIILELQSKLKPLKLRGQFEYIENTQKLLFIGTPWFTDISRLPALGLTMQDFAIYDTQLDLLQALNSQESITADIRILLTKINSQKKEIERHVEALRNNQSQLHLLSIIAERTVNGVVITNNKGQIEWVNSSFTKITGYTLEEVEGKPPGSFLQGPDSDKNTIKYMGSMIKHGLDFSAEIINYHKDGTKYWIKVSGHPIKNEKGEVIKYFALEEDITTRMATEQALRDAKEKADASSYAKDIFLANMSHEMRTPLNAMLGMGNQLKKTRLNQEQSFFLDTINAAADHLLVVINDILDLSRIEAGKLQLEDVDFDIVSLISRCMQVLSPKAEEKGIDFKMHIDERISKAVIGDPYRLNQILLNLLNNSIKFTNEGRVSIEVLVIKDEFEQQHLRFIVEDTGIGMDEKFTRHIFQKFTQEDSSIARKYGGTGLGLNITKQLVELMDGEIHVKSVKGKGSLFLVDLVFKKGREENIIKEQKIEVSSSILRGVKVLLVEDNEMNRILARTILKNYNAHIVEAENGLKAIELIQNESFDIVLMDIQMPIMGGFEATSHIREKLNMNIPIIALTANALKGEKEKCINAGMDAYLSKPFKDEDLVRLIASLLNLNIKVSETTPLLIDDTITNSEIMIDNIPDEIAETTISSDDITSYNLEFLKETFGDEPDIMYTMLEAFISEAEFGIQQTRKHLSEQNTEGLRAVAHRLKASLEMLNAHAMKDIALNIEVTVKSGNITDQIFRDAQIFHDNLVKILEKIKKHVELFAST